MKRRRKAEDRIVEIKKWQATYIAPLQPPTLATFRSWGSSAGAGRARPAGANIGKNIIYQQTKVVNALKKHSDSGTSKRPFTKLITHY